jgi:hypothetical protein
MSDSMGESIRDQMPDLFKAVNILKSKNIIYATQNDDVYQTLQTYADQINRNYLAIDDCEVIINREYRTASLHFLSSEPNALRKRLTQKEMRVFTSCYDLYRNHTAELGDDNSYIVPFDVLKQDMTEKELKLTNKKNEFSQADLDMALHRLEQFSLISVDKNEKEVHILPGICFCLNIEELEKLKGETLDTWLKTKGEEDNESEAE